jgi:hypothetical protein
LKDIFEIEPQDIDPYLEKLFMNTAIGGVGLSLQIYNEFIRNGTPPEIAYNQAISPNDTDEINLISDN